MRECGSRSRAALYGPGRGNDRERDESAPGKTGAEDETRTRDSLLGKQGLYQLSYFRFFHGEHSVYLFPSETICQLTVQAKAVFARLAPSFLTRCPWPRPAMRKLFRFLLKTLASALLLGLALALGMGLFVLPDSIQRSFEASVTNTTGLLPTVAGGLALTLRPSFGIKLKDVRLRNPVTPRELASASEVFFRVDPLPLLQRQMQIQELAISDLQINWHVDSEGRSIWETEQIQSLFNEASDPDITSSNGLLIVRQFLENLDRITLINVSVDGQDLQDNRNYSLRRLNLIASDANLYDRPFPLEASFEWGDPNRAPTRPVQFSSRNRLNLDTRGISIQDLQIAVTPMQLRGELTLQEVTGNLRWSGTLQSNAFSLADLLDGLGLSVREHDPLSPPFASTDASQQAQLQIDLIGDHQQLRIPALEFSLGSMRLISNAEVTFGDALTPTNISYIARTNALDFSAIANSIGGIPDILATEVIDTTGAGENETPEIAVTEPQVYEPRDFSIPKVLFDNANIRGVISIEALQVADAQLGYVNVYTNLEDAVLDIEIEPAGVLGGFLQGNMRLDARAEEIALQSRISGDGIDISTIKPPVLARQAVRGLLTFDSQLTARGNTLNTWLDTISGTTGFVITNNSVNLSVVKQVFGAIATLSPRGEIVQQWPDEIQFAAMGGYLMFDNGIDADQGLHVRLDNFDISGTGGINRNTETFSYDLFFTVLGDPHVQTLHTDSSYHNVPWPVQCGAEFGVAANQLCRPDFSVVRQLFAQLSNNAVFTQAADLAVEQVLEQLPDPGREILRSLFLNQANF
jgi:AsmA protein